MDNQNIGTSKFYTLIFLALVLVTVISTGLSQLNLGYLNVVFTVGLAAVSGAIVFTSFMQMKLDGSFARLLIAGLLALALLVFFIAFVG